MQFMNSSDFSIAQGNGRTTLHCFLGEYSESVRSIPSWHFYKEILRCYSHKRILVSFLIEFCQNSLSNVNFGEKKRFVFSAVSRFGILIICLFFSLISMVLSGTKTASFLRAQKNHLKCFMKPAIRSVSVQAGQEDS